MAKSYLQKDCIWEGAVLPSEAQPSLHKHFRFRRDSNGGAQNILHQSIALHRGEFLLERVMKPRVSCLLPKCGTRGAQVGRDHCLKRWQGAETNANELPCLLPYHLFSGSFFRKSNV